jgi:diguanylate cyclase (GGDEF)-like protein/PAS domain S-box-containing protein
MFDFIRINWFKAYILGLFTSFIGCIALSVIKPSFDNLSSFALTYLILITLSLTSLLIIKKHLQKWNKTAQYILNNIDDGISVKDEEGKFVYCNEKIAEHYGTTTKDIIGKSDHDFTTDTAQADFFRENLNSILLSFEKQEVCESSTNVNTGETHHFSSIKIPFKNMYNEKRLLILAKDITELTQVTTETERSRSRLEKALDVSEECLWEWNIQTNEVKINRQWKYLTGIEETEDTFEEFNNAILPEDREKVHLALSTLIERNEPFNIEFRIKRPDDRIVWAWDRGRIAEYDEQGNPLWVVGITMDITTSKLAQQKIETLAYYDQLTGLANRTTLEHQLRKVTGQKQPSQTYNALLFIDLDRFKLLNDSYGHFIGDLFLKTIATRLKNLNIENATIARFGGDEFAILLPQIHSHHQDSCRIAQVIGDNVVYEASKLAHLKNDNGNLDIQYSATSSVGGIVFNSNNVTCSEALQLADLTLYRMKAAGGNGALVLDIDMQDDLRKSNKLNLAMHDSVVNRDFCIYLQPKQNTNEELVGAEALVRWNHPTLGVLAPGAFLGMAEENNFILPIGEFVLEKSCEQLKKWQSKEETKHLQLSVNLSAKQIWQGSFCQDLINIIERYNIEPSKLVLEVTESMLIQDISDATEKLTTLRNYGVFISLDDFGTGYSSLNYLKSLPLDEIKIDRSFIHDIADNSQARVMVKSIIDLATNFNLNIVSEGVETKEQVDTLRDLGTTLYQGYYFSKPIPCSEFHKKYFPE